MKGKIFFIIALCIFLTGALYGCVEEKEENKAPTCTLAANPNVGTAPITVTFTLTASDSDGSISSWKLDIDNDGNTDYSGTGNPPSTRVHTYATQGSYTAKLTVTDNEEKTGIDTITITVNEPATENQSPTCTLSVTPSSGYVPLGVTFSMDADDPDGTITSWSLDINNDGTVDYSGTGNPSSTRTHTYTNTGTFTAKLTVIDNQGASDTDTVTISVTEEPSGNQSPTCSLVVNPTSGYAPLSVTFSMSASDPDGSISSWDLDINNDGLHDYSGSGNPLSPLQHTYTNIGTYTAKLTVTDNQGATASYTRTITVSQASQNQPPICSLSANPSSGYVPLSVIFTLSGTDPDGTISSWALDVNNDGTPEYSGAGTPPSSQQHTYQNIGTFTAKLTVIDDDSATDIDTVIITINQGTQPGYSRSNPAPIGSTLLHEEEDDWLYGDYKVRVTLLQVIRGTQAWTMIEDANMFNDEPDPGYEYILAKIRFEYLESSEQDTQYSVTEYDFTVVSESGVDYDLPSVVEPEPDLDGNLYPGATVEGWAAYQVAITDDHPLLTFGRDWLGKDGIWFKLY